MSSTTPISSYLPVRDEWLARRHEAALEPTLPIVDPHHHLWERPGWVYMMPDLLADLGAGHNVVATVFVQCRAMYRAQGPEAMRPLGETEFVTGVAAMSDSGGYGPARVCRGIVGHADLRLGAAVQQVLEAQIRAGGGRFRGIRHISAWDADSSLLNTAYQPGPHLLADAGFREGFARLAPLDLAFDAWLYHPQIPELVDLARAFPDTRIVLDHVGGPLGSGVYTGRGEEVFAAWRAAMAELAGCANVCMKLGGLGMKLNGYDFHQQADPPSSQRLAAAWKPWIDTTIELFGAERCMFESNFPVDKGSYAYAECWNAFKRLASGAGEAEKTALFSGTAQRFYKLDL